MKLGLFLKELSITATFFGECSFDTLGLAGSVCGKRLLTFIDSEKFIPSLSKDVKVILTTEDLKDRLKKYELCVCETPRKTFFLVHNYLADGDGYSRPLFATKIGKDCTISPHACISKHNVVIGDNVVIEEFVSIKSNVTIGSNCVIRAGSIIGGEGFEQKRDDETVWGVKHLGGVIMGNNVEIQQNNTLDKAIYPWDNTEIGDYCKTDNLVHIAHAVKMKKRVLIAAQSCIAGRVTLEDNVWIGPGVTVINGITVGANARVNIGSTATQDVPAGKAVTGNFAIDHQKFIENLKKVR